MVIPYNESIPYNSDVSYDGNSVSPNGPATIWRKTNGLNDNKQTGLIFIIDPQGDFLVDPQGDNVIDTGVEMNVIPASIWEKDDSR